MSRGSVGARAAGRLRLFQYEIRCRIVAWLLESAGIDAGSIEPPAGGRAPGWDAGVAVARR